MHVTGDEAYRIVRHLPPDGGIERAIVDDGAGAAELLIIPLRARSAWEHQVRVMAESPSAHIPTLRDLALDPDGTLRIVRQLVTGDPVSELLATPGWCTPGRAVTLLHPVVSTVRAAHDSGAVLGGPDAARIRVTAEGRPVLAELTGAHRAAPLPTALRAKDPAHRADIDALERLRSAVVHALDSSGFADTAASLPAISDALADPDVMLRWSAAEPLVAGPRPAPAPVLPRAGASMPTPRAPERRKPPVEAVTRVMHQAGLPTTVTHRVEQAATDVLERVRAVRGQAARLPRRTLVLAAAGAAVLAAIVVTAALPTSSGAPVPPAGAAMVSEGEDSEEGDDGGAFADTATADRAQDPAQDPDPADWSAVVRALVERWSACVHDQRRLCDEALHDSSSAAALRAADGDLVVGTVLALIEAESLTVVMLERSGDAVVVRLEAAETSPASLLMIRSEAGWRIRDAWS
ncbi:MAG: hypothetical protein ACXIUP_02825 [Microcella sp.]